MKESGRLGGWEGRLGSYRSKAFRQKSSTEKPRCQMSTLTVEIPTSLKIALEREISCVGGNESATITAALAIYLDTPVHTLFQVSTSGALVAGVSSGAVSAKTILDHGDFGLGTFADLDGEMVVLDGHVYRVQGSGRVTQAVPNAQAPFAVVTRFAPQIDVEVGPFATLAALQAWCDRFRNSGNIFYAFRLDGRFSSIRTRAVSPSRKGVHLVDAAKSQSEFNFSNIDGTLVGLWSPGFSSAFSIAGYHFHFISEDRQHGGHLLGCAADRLQLRMEALNNFHLALPENESFLKADLSKSTAEELAYAEQAH
jgi:acetolactate decarboxylase